MVIIKWESFDFTASKSFLAAREIKGQLPRVKIITHIEAPQAAGIPNNCRIAI